MIFLINLDDAVERRRWMTGQLAGQGLAFERIGVDFRRRSTAEVHDWMVERFPTLHFDVRALSAPEIGCWASHLTAWQCVLANDHCVAATVIEDDIALAPDFAAAVAALQHAPRYDLVYLGTSSRNLSGRRQVRHGGRVLHEPVGAILNTWGYVVSRGWLQRFFGVPRLRIGLGIDEFLGGRGRVVKPRIAVLQPPVVTEHPALACDSQIAPYTFRMDRSRLFEGARRRFIRSRAGALYYSLYRWL
jgi:hypothetical protein